MKNYNRKRISQFLPQSLLDSAITLEGLGFDEYAWNWHDVVQVIEILATNKMLILGGDVYSISNGELKSTGDNWYINRANYELNERELNKARDISNNYIKEYTEKHGENYYYSVVVNY